MTKDKFMTIRIAEPTRSSWTDYAKSEGITVTKLIESAVAQRMELGSSCISEQFSRYNKDKKF